MNKVPGIITDEVVTPKVETPMKNILLDIILCAGIIAIIILNGCLYSEVKNINDSISKINKRLDNINIDINIDDNLEKELYLCPYCNNGLTIYASSGVSASVAQLRCSYCGFRTPEVNINESNAKLKCIKKCRENFKNNNWTDEDFLGEAGYIPDP